mgnify:CR=1 FL=1
MQAGACLFVKHDDKGGTGSPVGKVDAPATGLHQAAYDAQPHARPAGFAAGGIERVKAEVAVASAGAGAVVGAGERHSVALTSPLHL